MNLEQLRKQLEIDEGVKYEIYLDHLGLPTFGIGHLVIKTDAESGQDVGTAISEERVRECFEADVLSVIKDCNKLLKYCLKESSNFCGFINPFRLVSLTLFPLIE